MVDNQNFPKELLDTTNLKKLLLDILNRLNKLEENSKAQLKRITDLEDGN